MAAPTKVARGTPAGHRLEDGFQAFYAFQSNATLGLWEIDVKPVGVDGGDPIDINTQHDTDWDQFAPKQRKRLTPGQMRVAYDPDKFDDVVALINVVTSVTVYYPDGSSDTFWGYLKSIEKDNLTFGNMPTANCEIIPTNRDPVLHVKAAPFHTSTPGT